MKKLLLSAGLLLAMNLSFAGAAVKAINTAPKNVIEAVSVSAREVKVTYNVSSCTATASIGVGATKIELSATAPTCKEAIAMIQAAMQ